MLIAIMGDTFGKVTEVKEQSGLREKVSILADYVWMIPMEVNEVKYIYALKPKAMNEEESSSWEGTVTTLRKHMDKHMKDQKSSFSKKIANVDIEVKQATDSIKQLEEKVNGLQGL